MSDEDRVEEEAAAVDPADPDEGKQTSARGPRLTRRRLMALIGGGFVAGGLWRVAVVDKPKPLKEKTLSDAARKMIAKAWEGLDPQKVIDIYVHIVGLGVGGTGCFVHPDATSFLAPTRWVPSSL